MNDTEHDPNAETAENPVPHIQVKQRRGFALWNKEALKLVSTEGGKRAHEAGTAHKFTPETASRAGRKGGLAPHRARGRSVKSETEGAR